MKALLSKFTPGLMNTATICIERTLEQGATQISLDWFRKFTNHTEPTKQFSNITLPSH